MASFVVMQPPAGRADALPQFVRDGFSVWAFLLPPLWLARHRLWIEAALALGAALVVPAVAVKLGVGLIATWLTALVGAFVALEGPALRLAALRRAGWTEEGVYDADTLDDAETRYAAETFSSPWGA